MPQIESLCPECQTKITKQIGQAVIKCRLRWYSSYQCSFCGTAVEMDDFGFPPDEIRPIVKRSDLS